MFFLTNSDVFPTPLRTVNTSVVHERSTLIDPCPLKNNLQYFLPPIYWFDLEHIGFADNHLSYPVPTFFEFHKALCRSSRRLMMTDENSPISIIPSNMARKSLLVSPHIKTANRIDNFATRVRIMQNVWLKMKIYPTQHDHTINGLLGNWRWPTIHNIFIAINRLLRNRSLVTKFAISFYL